MILWLHFLFMCRYLFHFWNVISQLYDPTQPPPTALVPSFLVSVDSTNFVTLSRTEYHYSHDRLNTSVYSASVSAMPNDQKGFQVTFRIHCVIVKLLLWFSFGSTKVNIWKQTVTLDWITGLGIIAGALGFLRSIYTLIFLIVDKIHEKCTQPPEEKKRKKRDDYELTSE